MLPEVGVTVEVEEVAVVEVTIRVKVITRLKVNNKVKSTNRAMVMIAPVVVEAVEVAGVTEVVEVMVTMRTDSHVGTVVMSTHRGSAQLTTSCATTANEWVTLPVVAILRKLFIMRQMIMTIRFMNVMSMVP